LSYVPQSALPDPCFVGVLEVGMCRMGARFWCRPVLRPLFVARASYLDHVGLSNQ
jgi:hypothetical protein